jgi:cytidine deaminase
MPAVLPKTTLNNLLAQAMRVSRNAYCKASEFPVGAAVLTDKGDIYTGCNVENASYGLTSCAERNAIFQMIAQGGKKIRAVVVYTPTKKPASPCGACRQVINEFGPRAQIISVCKGPKRINTTLNRLLPHAFGPANLPNKRRKKKALT